VKARAFLKLTKPGIVLGNAINVAAGFLLAAGTKIDFGLLLSAVVGLSLVIASACVFNNYIDRGIDLKMKRTKNRALVTGEISGPSALLFGTLLGITGGLLLGIFTNALTLEVALFGFFAYVVLYGLAKRRTSWGTVVGSLPGATPPVVGYTAVTGQLDGGALILYLILILWQMPHFYAIAIYRSEEYKAAGLPVLPLVKGIRATKIHILLYQIGFLLAVSALTAYGYAGYTYLFLSLAAGLIWLKFGIAGFWATDNNRWARQLFGFSLIVTMVMAVALAVGNVLP
jgi:protoheme IX farnesyltransferase